MPAEIVSRTLPERAAPAKTIQDIVTASSCGPGMSMPTMNTVVISFVIGQLILSGNGDASPGRRKMPERLFLTPQSSSRCHTSKAPGDFHL